MVVNQAVLSALFKGFKVIFFEAFKGHTSDLKELAMEVTSKGKSVEYKWLKQVSGMREWIGERFVKSLAAAGFVVKNKTFEDTVAVDRDDIEDDETGMYTPAIQSIAIDAKEHPMEMVVEAIINGFSSSCHDGVFFFDAAHPNGKAGTYSNKGVGVLNETNYGVARAGMMSLSNESGKSLKIIPNKLYVSPQLEAAAKKLVTAEKGANGETNIYKDSADIVVLPELAAYPTYWFLGCTKKKAIKPFIVQKRRAVEFVALFDPSSSNVFHKKEYIFGVDYRGNVAYAFPQLMFGSTGGA